MKCYKHTLYVNPYTGDCSDGTNMWDWSVSRLKHVLDYCWNKDIADLARRILQRQKEQLKKLLPDEANK